MRARRQRRLRARHDRRGVALILVMGAVTVLTLFLTELQENTSAELSAALAERDALKAEYHARSAVNLGRLVIATEPTVRNALLPIFMMMGMRKAPQLPVWNFADMLLGPFNDSTGAAAFGGTTGLDMSSAKNLGLSGGGRFEIKIVDEEAKINVNLAAKGHTAFQDQSRLAQQLLTLFNQEQYRPLFEARDADGQFSDAPTICTAIIDWADDDEQMNGCKPLATDAAAASSGVEDNYYQVIGQTYLRKNAAFDSLEELRMVRGFGEDFWATFVDPDPDSPDKRLLTVWGRPNATINVNAASAQALWAIACTYADPTASPLCTDPTQMMSFLTGLNLVQSMLGGVPVFGSGNDFYNAITGKGKAGGIGAMVLGALGVQPIQVMAGKDRDLKNAVSTDSRFFSIYAEGVIPGNKRETRVRIHAVVDITGAQALSEETQGIPLPNQGGTPLTPVELEQKIRLNPAGNIVYWRIE